MILHGDDVCARSVGHVTIKQGASQTCFHRLPLLHTQVLRVEEIIPLDARERCNRRVLASFTLTLSGGLVYLFWGVGVPFLGGVVYLFCGD